jgi:hypothetical protein
MKPEGVACFAGDLPEAEQKLVWATHAAPAADLFNQKVEGTAWRSKPSWYIVATKDRTVQPELQRFVAKRMEAITVETASSHVPMLSLTPPRTRCHPQGPQTPFKKPEGRGPKRIGRQQRQLRNRS